ncbi:MAG: hypothetical protein H7331_06585 [Bacteroidia bacterium]|nr:hypothetical protein [Bacteroidia bacterium]
MKATSTILLATTLLITSATQAQKVTVEETKEVFAVGTVSAFKTTIPYAKLKNVNEEWLKWQKDRKGIVKENKSNLFSDNTVIAELGTGTVDIYSTVKQKDAQNIELIVAYDFDGKYINSAEMTEKATIVKAQLQSFGLKLAVNEENQQLKENNKALEKLTKKQKNLENDNADYNTEIAKNKSKIEKNNNELTFKEEALAKKKDEVTIQKRVVDASVGAVDEQAKSSKKIYEKQKSAQLSLEKDIKNIKNNTVDCKDVITKNESKLTTNETTQVANKKSIADQSVIVESNVAKIKILTE